MKVAIPAWAGRVSTVFDFAQRLLVLDLDHAEEVSRIEVPLDEGPSILRAKILSSLGVEVLICGAISRPLAGLVRRSGIQIIPFVTGKIDDVVDAFVVNFRLATYEKDSLQDIDLKQRGCLHKKGNLSMDPVKVLEENIGGRWIGIVFERNNAPKENLAKRPIRLCEAVKQSITRPIVLTRHLVSCPGARRSLGWTTTDDDKIARNMVEATGIKANIAKKLVTNTPCLNGTVAAVSVGGNDHPDVVLSYAQPEAVMRLVRRWQEFEGTDLDLETSSVMAVCGSVVVKAYTTGRICLSFGCPDSRKYGAIGRDRLVVGLPVRLVEYFL